MLQSTINASHIQCRPNMTSTCTARALPHGAWTIEYSQPEGVHKYQHAISSAQQQNTAQTPESNCIILQHQARRGASFILAVSATQYSTFPQNTPQQVRAGRADKRMGRRLGAQSPESCTHSLCIHTGVTCRARSGQSAAGQSQTSHLIAQQARSLCILSVPRVAVGTSSEHSLELSVHSLGQGASGVHVRHTNHTRTPTTLGHEQ